MTEPFRVPERLQLAIRPGRGDEPFRSVMDVVDVPALCRAEVERALVEQSLATGVHPSIRDWRDKYLAARFPEAAPETVWASGYVEPDKTRNFIDEAPEILRRFNERIGAPTPSAPAETGIVCRVAGCGRTVFTAMAGTCDICLNIEREARRRMVDPPSVPAEPQKDGLWAEAEREFVRALALWAKANVPKEYRDVHYAARRVLEMTP